ncbi:MAG: hypothetical protein HS119_14380 [Flavobacteriales bacterium]|nr:hypothetical protein [Flavobacteriales bacterium]
MKIKNILSIFLLFCLSTFFAQENKLLDDFIYKLNPEGYSSYKQSEAILQQSTLLANEFSVRLSNFQNLVVSSNPQELLNDFNLKMQEIEKIEAEFNQRFNSQTIKHTANALNSFSSGDTWGAIGGVFGALNSSNQQQKAEMELAQQRQLLINSKNDQMSKIYTKAQELNQAQKNDFIKAAAYAEHKQDEQYNLAFVDNIQCFSNSMKQNFNTYNSSWLNNYCPKPVKSNETPFENKFVTKDVQYSKIADNKFKVFKQTNYEDFRESAISYAASAAKIKPSAKYFAQIADYYYESSTVLSLSNYLAASYYDTNYLNLEQKTRIEELKGNAEIDISEAISKFQKDYLDAFIKTGLDKVIKINDRTILNHAIMMDKPNSVQLILNHYVDGLEQDELTNRIQKVILICTASNSTATLERFIELGVSIDFVLNNYSPIDVAAQYGNLKAFALLLKNSEQKTSYEEKYKNTDVYNNLLTKEKEDKIIEENRKITDNPRNIINDYVMAITGTSNLEDAKKKLLSVTDITTESEIIRSTSYGTMTNSLLTKNKFPNLFYSNDNSAIETYFDGNEGSTVIKIMKEKMTTPFPPNHNLTSKILYQMHIELFYEDLGFKLNYIGTEVINEKLCKKVEIVSPGNNSTVYLYFDTTSKLKIAEQITDKIDFTRNTYFNNYTSIDGIQFSLNQTVNDNFTSKENYNSSTDIQIKSIKLNANIPVSVFKN